MIPDQSIDEVRARSDLVDIVGEVVSLKRSGREWKGKCPFHDDRTPSFYVVPEKGFYKCFGCGESGDVFTFLMKRSGMEFLDTVRHLAERYGVDLKEVTGRGEEEDPFQPHYEANAFARDWFRRQLQDSEVGRVAREYLEGRGIDAETSERFGLGFAPNGWRGLREAASAHEIPEALLLEVGLLTTSERSSEPYDRFRNRIIFPIESGSGRIVAFGGRVLPGDGPGAPKYLNSPESPIYHKGEVLYALGWNRNAIRREGVVLVVEGYMDVVALGAAGVDHAVATLGTAMTSEQARLLQRYTHKALLLFDSDEAGLRATFRAADLLLAHGIHPSVVTLPAGEDPDSLVQAEGPQGLQRHLDAAVDVLDRKLQMLDEKGYFDSIERVRTTVDKLLPTLRAVVDPALRDIYVDRVSRKTGVRRETLEVEVLRRETGYPGAGGGPGGGPRARGEGASRPGARGEGTSRSGARGKGLPRLGPERQLLVVLLRNREWVDRALERVGPGEFRDPTYREIFEALVDDPQILHLPEGAQPDTIRVFEELLGDPEDVEHTERLFQDSVADLQDRPLQDRQRAFEQRLEEATSDEEARGIVEELTRLRKERRGRWNVILRGRDPIQQRSTTAEGIAAASGRERPAGFNQNDQRVDE
jgi:DNA primase